MHDDTSWDRIVDAIEGNFGLDNHGRLNRPIADHLDLTEQVAFIEFTRDGDKYRLERITGPAIIDKKAIGGRRVGAELRYETIYDAHETARHTNYYKDDGGEWVKLDPSALGL
ncbi:hypothetical protein HJC99_05210 [Candidatus Saccharibacteria bacterium]|nr:hypothetical protein [Candidatus Saccharibacteria bacterium]